MPKVEAINGFFFLKQLHLLSNEMDVELPVWRPGTTGPDPKFEPVVANGILGLKTFKLHPHSPDFVSRTKAPCDYDPSATCPT